MAEKTGIAWTRSTFNPWMGCTKVGPGCDNCYAAVSRPVMAMAIQWGSGAPRRLTSAENWKNPVRWNKLAGIEQATGIRAEAVTGWTGRHGFWPVFCSSLADFADNEVDPAWQRALAQLIAGTPNLTWLLLTKRIGNVLKLYPEWADGLPRNAWLGATVVTKAEAARDLPKLLAIKARRRFVSNEPALEAVDFSPYFEEFPDHNGVRVVQNNEGIDWIITGAESDQGGTMGRPFELAWARSVVEQCRAAGVAPFVKQLGRRPYADARSVMMLKDRAGANPAEWPADLQVQEFPC